MQDKPRYSRISDILQVLVLMQSRPLGVTIQDIQREFNVSRRTAERMRESITNIFPQIDEIESSDRVKHWGFTGGYLNEIIVFTPEELANLEKLKEIQRQQGFFDKEKLLDSIVTKIKALSRKSLNKIENVLEILLQTEGYAVRQMPNHNIDINTLSTIREAMKENKKITATYNEKNKTLSPYGLIYGEKIYLIAREEEKGPYSYNYLLYKCKNVKLTDQTFDKGDFDLKEFSEKSFGIYQGQILEVKLQFKKEVADEVLIYHFHPTQKIKQNEDGTVNVKFKASGEYEILWHLFRWGTSVKILSPKSLKNRYIEMLEGVLKNQKKNNKHCNY